MELTDAEKYGITITPALAASTQHYYKVVKVYHYPVGQNGGYPGNRNLFMDVLGVKGKRVDGAQIVVLNTGNGQQTIATVDKPDNEPGTNVQINPGDTLSAWVKSDTFPSERINGVHTRHPDEGEDVRVAHHSFLVVWQLVERASEPEPGQPPEPEEVTEEMIRNAAWNRVYPVGGIAFNPQAAFQAEARELGLGVPVTNEFDFGPYRVQGYAGGILYALIGEWQNIVELEW